MDFQLAFVIVLILFVIMVVYHFFKMKSLDKLLYDYKPLKQKYDKLVEDHERLQLKFDSGENKSDSGNAKNKSAKKEKNADKSKQKRAKSQSSQASPVVSDLQEKVRNLEEENAKLKEKNFNLSKDNKELRKDVRSNSESSEQDQHELIDLREEREKLTAELDNAKVQISMLEKLIAQASDAPMPKNEDAGRPAEKESRADVEKLERDKASLQLELKDVKGELDAFKRDFRGQVEEAKKTVADSNKSLRNDLAKAERAVQQLQKRADNNHKVYLIARAQMMLAEKRLQTFDPGYQSPIALPASHEAIDEVIKKINTADARQTKTSENAIHQAREIESLNETIQSLRAEIETLKSGKSDKEFPSSDSFSDLVSQLSNVADNLTSSGNSETTKDFSNLDFSGLDDWDGILN